MCAMGRAVGRRKVSVDWTRGSDESCGKANRGTVVTKYTCKYKYKYTCKIQIEIAAEERTVGRSSLIHILIQIYTRITAKTKNLVRNND